MLPGHFVYTADHGVRQVRRLINSAVDGYGGTVVPGTLWELAKAGEPDVYVGPIPNQRPPGWTQQQYLDRLHQAPRMLPACKGCTAMPGYPCRPACPVGDQGRVPAPVTL